MPLGRIGMQSVQMSAPGLPQPTGGGFERGRRTARTEQRQDTADARQSTQDDLSLMEAALKDPNNAPAMYNAAGKEYTPEIQELLKRPQETAKVTEALRVAKDSGVKDPQTLKVFLDAYRKGGVDLAYQSIDAMPRGGAEMPKTTGLPKGKMWDNTGAAVDIPGVARSDYASDVRQTPAAAAKIYEEDGVVDQRLAMDYPEIGGDYDMNEEAMLNIRKSMAQNMGSTGNFEDSYSQTMDELTGGQGLELQDDTFLNNYIWGFDDPSYNFPSSVSPAPPVPPMGGGAPGEMDTGLHDPGDYTAPPNQHRVYDLEADSSGAAVGSGSSGVNDLSGVNPLAPEPSPQAIQTIQQNPHNQEIIQQFEEYYKRAAGPYLRG